MARRMPRTSLMRGVGQRFVYLLHSESDPTRHYVGVTADVDERLDWHNSGGSGYTPSHRPWGSARTVVLRIRPVSSCRAIEQDTP